MTNIKQKTMDIPVKTILERAVQYLQGIHQEWQDTKDVTKISFANAMEQAASAVALVELVEVHHCGSIGGHADGQTYEQRETLIARINYLADYYGVRVLTPDEKEIVEAATLVVDRLCKKQRSRHVQSYDIVSAVLAKDQAKALRDDLEMMFDVDTIPSLDVKEYFTEKQNATIEEMALDLLGYTAKDRFTKNDEDDDNETDEDEDENDD